MAQIHPKVSASVVAGALTGLILSELNRRGITIAPDEAADITVLLSALAAYWMPSGDGQVVNPPPAPAPQAPVQVTASVPQAPAPVLTPVAPQV